MNEQLKSQVLDQLKSANNVLVAVSSNPTVDELSASIALTLLLNKMNKHATTVFSGVVPSTLEFLQPEKTIETTTDSLRDFIIALDKSKADKLRYKVEDDVVRIFITPYRTSIDDKDLEFSQGDFNVDVVIALGVTKREDLDRAITSHGRILHDASVISLTKRDVTSELGSLNWQEPLASSLCEMVSVLSLDLDRAAIDGQMATALMTGIIAETDRFRNDKTTPLALSLSSQLMSAGANQQLIAEKLEEPVPIPEVQQQSAQFVPMEQASPVDLPEVPSDDGSLEIDHEDDIEKIHIDEHGNLFPIEETTETLPPQPEQDLYYGADTTPAEETELNASDETTAPIQSQQPAQDDSTGDSFEVNDHNKLPESDGESSSVAPVSDSSEHYLDTPTKSDDTNDAAAVPEKDHAIPTLTHGKTISPPTHGNELASDKPFDLQEALKNEIAKDETAAGLLPPLPTPQPAQSPLPSAPVVADEASPAQPAKEESLLDLEKAIDSPHLNNAPAPPQPQVETQDSQNIDTMRDAVAKAADAVVSPFPTPNKSLGAQPVEFQQSDPVQTPPTDATPKVIDPNAAPPVPPPMPLAPQFYDENGNNQKPLN